MLWLFFYQLHRLVEILRVKINKLVRTLLVQHLRRINEYDGLAYALENIQRVIEPELVH
jgi:hypothetical protein